MVVIDGCNNEMKRLFEMADLSRPVPDNARRLVQEVKEEERIIDVGDHSVFYRECFPPIGNFAKGVIVFLHGQSYTSATWSKPENLKTFAALGYHCIAPDMPGCGQTRGPSVAQTDKPIFFQNFVAELGFKQVMVIFASMSSQYILPLLKGNSISCAVAIAPSNTHEVTVPTEYRTPLLVIWGDRDTSLGLTAASNLKPLPNCRLQKIPGAGHACYLGNATAFQEVSLNFFDLVRSYRFV